jgi:HEAT repeat protein
MGGMRGVRGKAWALGSFAGLAILVVIALPTFRELALEHWAIHRLGSPIWAERKAAAGILAEMGSTRAIPILLKLFEGEGQPESQPLFEPVKRCLEKAGRAAIPALSRYLKDGKGAILVVAARALHQVDPANPGVLLALGRAIREPPLRVQEAAADAMEEFGHDTVAPLRAFLDHQSDEVRDWAAARLSQIGPQAASAAPALIRMLQDPALEVRVSAAAALAQMEVSQERILPILIDEVTATGVDKNAAWGICTLGKQAAAAVPALIERCLKNKDQLALYSLIAIGEPAVPAICRLVQESDDSINQRVIEVLKAMRGEARSALPVLLDVLKGRYWETTAAAAAEALSEIGEPEAVVPALIEALYHEHADVGKAAMRSLAKLGPAAEAAIPRLVLILWKPSQEEKEEAARAIALIGPRPQDLEPMPPYKEGLLGPSARLDLWITCARIRASRGREAELVGELLGKRTNVGKPEWAEALGALGPAARDAVPALVRMAREGEIGIGSLEAARALARIDPETAGGLAEDLRSADRVVRWRAASGLAAMEPPPASALPALVKALADPVDRVRWNAAQALGALGREGEPALEPLLSARRDRNRFVRLEARKAMERILCER